MKREQTAVAELEQALKAVPGVTFCAVNKEKLRTMLSALSRQEQDSERPGTAKALVLLAVSCLAAMVGVIAAIVWRTF